MSTTELYLTEEEIKNFIRETKAAAPKGEFYTYGYEGQEYGVCPFITFYIYHKQEDFERIARRVIELHQVLETMIDRPYKKILKSSTETWFKAGDKRLPTDLRDEVRIAIQKGESFWLQATDQDSVGCSARWAIDAQISDCTAMEYSTVKITFRHGWYLENKDTWNIFVHNWLGILQPDQCYSGFEIGNTASGYGGAYESDVMERICADYFYGLDIDHPNKTGFHFLHEHNAGYVNVSCQGAGLRTPTWCFLLSPHWIERLGLTEEKLYLAFGGLRPEITTIRHENAQVSYWIQLGELSLHPVEDGVPRLLAAASRLIRPVRCNDLELSSLDPWDEDPNPRFDTLSGPRWMARFDEDSDWPNPKQRGLCPPSPPPQKNYLVFSALPGELCPHDGNWIAPHWHSKEMFIKKGQKMPGPKYGATGGVTWYLKIEQP